MFQIIRKKYQRHDFELERFLYYDLPKDLEFQVGDTIQQADDEEQEYLVQQIINEEVYCTDLQTKLKRVFYKDSCRLSAKELQRKKKAVSLQRKNEKWAKKESRKKDRALKLFLKLEKEDKKKLKKHSFKKQKELIIKFE